MNKKKSTSDPRSGAPRFPFFAPHRSRQTSPKSATELFPLASLLRFMKNRRSSEFFSQPLSSFFTETDDMIVDGNCSDKCVLIPDIGEREESPNRRLKVSPVVLMEERRASLRKNARSFDSMQLLHRTVALDPRIENSPKKANL